MPCTASSLQDFDCMQNLRESGVNSAVDIHWAVDSALERISFAFQATTSGYVAVGFSDSDGGMLTSDAVIGSSGTVVPYVLTKKRMSGVLEDPNQTISGESVSTVDGVTTMYFTRALDNGGVSVITADGTASTNMVWAYSDGSAVENHGGTNRGVFSITFGGDTDTEGSSGETGGDVEDSNNEDGGDSSSSTCTFSSLGFNCQLSLSDTADIHWTVAPTEDSISFALEAQTSGYVAVGFSRSGVMVDTDAVVGTVQGETTTVDPYVLTSQTDYGVNPSPAHEIYNTSISLVDGTTTMRFARFLENGGESVIDLNSPSKMVWAHSDSDSPVVDYHAQFRGQFEIDFLTGAATIADPYNYALLHGALMVVAWMILFPSGVLVARFGKSMGPTWFKLHRGCMVLALGFALAGLVAIGSQDSTRLETTKGHRMLGLIVLVIVFAQPLNAIVRPHVGTAKRPAWNCLHHWFGRAGLGFGIVNVFFGLKAAENRDGWLDEYGSLQAAVIALLVVIICSAVVLNLRKNSPVGATVAATGATDFGPLDGN